MIMQIPSMYLIIYLVLGRWVTRRLQIVIRQQTPLRIRLSPFIRNTIVSYTHYTYTQIPVTPLLPKQRKSSNKTASNLNNFTPNSTGISTISMSSGGVKFSIRQCKYPLQSDTFVEYRVTKLMLCFYCHLPQTEDRNGFFYQSLQIIENVMC